MWHDLFCADINDQSHLTAASCGFAQLHFCRTKALTVPQVNGLQIAIEIHRLEIFQLRILIYHVIVAVFTVFL